MSLRQRRRTARRAGRFLGVYIFLSVLLIAAVAVGGCIVFFKVNHFVVSGNNRYTAEEVVEATGVDTGDNLFLVDRKDTEGRVRSRLAYVNSVHVRWKLPDTLEISVGETNAAAAVYSEKEWWLMNVEGKLLEKVGKKKAKKYIKVTGLPLVAPKAGETLTVKADYRLMRKSLIELLTAMQGRELLQQVRSVKCNGEAQLIMDYNGQLQVKMLTDADYDYQVKMLEAVLNKYVNVNWAKDDKGALDMTYEDGHPHLTKERDEEEIRREAEAKKKAIARAKAKARKEAAAEKKAKAKAVTAKKEKTKAKAATKKKTKAKAKTKKKKKTKAKAKTKKKKKTKAKAKTKKKKKTKAKAKTKKKKKTKAKVKTKKKKKNR